MGNDRKCILALFALTFSGLAFAESTSDALTRIEAETMLLKAREKQLDVQANILSKQNEIALKQGIATTLPQISTGADPVLRGIEGLGTALYATLETGSGVFEVQRGEVLPNGMRVVAIAMNGVTLRDAAGRNVHLAVTGQNSAPGPANAGAAQGAGALPPLPLFAPAMIRGPAR
jgi:type IV pilus biogenesis protein PilP